MIQIAKNEILASVSPIHGREADSAKRDAFLRPMREKAMPNKNGKRGPAEVSAADPVGLPPEIADLGRRVLANCEDMQAANERLLDRNHELMTHERRKARGKTGKES